MRYDTVVFDLDGTLVDSYDALHASVNHTRRECGLDPLPMATVKSMVGDGLASLLERVFAPEDVPADAQRIFEEHYETVCCSASRLLDGVAETLERLHSAGATMAVCTNKPTSFSVRIIEHLGLDVFVPVVLGPDAAGARKPAAEHVNATIERAGGNVERALFVGDMTIDIEAARNAGIDVAVIPTGAVGIETLRAASADYYLDSFSDLQRIVLGDGS